MRSETWPGWPRLLSREQLRLYLGGICDDTLVKICPVAPIELGARVVRWNRQQVDQWIDTLPSRTSLLRSANDNASVASDTCEPPGETQTAIMRARARALRGSG